MSHISIDLRMIQASGIGTYLKQLTPKLLSHFQGHFFSLLGSPRELRNFPWSQSDNVRVLSCTTPIYSIQEQLAFARLIPKTTDLFWSPHYNIPLAYRKKLLVTVHDLFPLAMLPSSQIPKRLYARLFFHRIKNRAQHILFNSEFTAEEFQRRVGKPRRASTVTPLDIDDSCFNLERQPRPFPEPYFFFVGNIKPHKNLKTLIQAFQRIQDKIPHRLVLAGKKDGFLQGDPEVEEFAKRHPEKILLTGQISDRELKRYLQHATALVFPSLYEGFGLPPLEAMAAGCPAVVSNAASIPEVCGTAALYFDPRSPEDIAEKLLLLTQDSQLRDDFIERGKRRAALFSQGLCAEKTIQVIEQML